MRVALVLLVIAACGGRGDRGPAWPRSAGTEIPDDASGDGGESLEPRSTAHPVAALEVAEDTTVAAAPPPPVEPTPTPTAPAVTPTPTPPTGETMEITVEEITITPIEAPSE